MTGPVLAGLGLAFPPEVSQDELWDGFFARHFGGGRAAHRIFTHAGVARRHAVVNPAVEDLSAASTGERMRRYLAGAAPLGESAARAALADAGVDPADLGLLVVVTCTGYATPGLDVSLVRDLGLPPTMRRLLIGHMGCYAALPGLSAAADFVATHRAPALLLCVELTSLHIQPPTPDGAPPDADQVVSHALFSDAAAAAVLTPAGATGYRVRDVVAVTDTSTADQMTWDVTDHGFRMGLSARVPDTLAGQLDGLVDDLLGRHGLTRADIAGWAVHPGGPRILDVVQRVLGLPPAALEPSRRTLSRHGNCSSATVLAVLDHLRETGTPPGRHVVLLAFGPGLTLYAALLQAAG